MREIKGILIAGELLLLLGAVGCMTMLFFRSPNIGIGFLCLACALLALYLATVRAGLKG